MSSAHVFELMNCLCSMKTRKVLGVTVWN